MTEKPILFSAPMVRALLDGRKTMTRRIVKGYALMMLEDFPPEFVADPENAALCPYPVGTRLWVKEPLKASDLWDGIPRMTYAADGVWVRDLYSPCPWPWKYSGLSSMFMPKGISRITLEVSAVRVERVQDITEEDAIAEGVDGCVGLYKTAFRFIWSKLHGPDAWDRNDWVWVYTFGRVA